jgi:hypothetical protein
MPPGRLPTGWCSVGGCILGADLRDHMGADALGSTARIGRDVTRRFGVVAQRVVMGYRRTPERGLRYFSFAENSPMI